MDEKPPSLRLDEIRTKLSLITPCPPKNGGTRMVNELLYDDLPWLLEYVKGLDQVIEDICQ